MNAVRSYTVSLKYQRFTTSGCRDIGITKIEFVAKTQFLWTIIELPTGVFQKCVRCHELIMNKEL